MAHILWERLLSARDLVVFSKLEPPAYVITLSRFSRNATSSQGMLVFLARLTLGTEGRAAFFERWMGICKPRLSLVS
jgi:hypothetical protein